MRSGLHEFIDDQGIDDRAPSATTRMAAGKFTRTGHALFEQVRTTGRTIFEQGQTRTPVRCTDSVRQRPSWIVLAHPISGANTLSLPVGAFVCPSRRRLARVW